MTASSGFWQQKQPAAVFKHRLLRNYVAPWATMVTAYGAHEAVFVDGYAGPGMYASADGEPGEVGSPLIAADVAGRLAQMQGPYRVLECEFVERDRRHAAALEQHLRADFPHVTWRVHHADLADRITEIMERVASRPSLIFLDPFGTSLPLDVLTGQVMGTASRTTPEVLLNFTIEGVWRIGGLLRHGHDQPALRRADRFLGGTWWRSLFAEARADAERSGDTTAAASAAREVAEGYRKLVQDRTGCSSIAVPVRRSESAPPFFQLTLFYRHPAAKMVFADAAAKANAEWHRTFFERMASDANAEKDGQGALFDAVSLADFDRDQQKRIEQARGRLENRIRALLERQPILDVGAELEAIYGSDLGTLTESDLRIAWRALAHEGLTEPPPTGKLRTQRIHRTATPSALPR